jgi:hypothetical protein
LTKILKRAIINLLLVQLNFPKVPALGRNNNKNMGKQEEFSPLEKAWFEKGEKSPKTTKEPTPEEKFFGTEGVERLAGPTAESVEHLASPIAPPIVEEEESKEKN